LNTSLYFYVIIEERKGDITVRKIVGLAVLIVVAVIIFGCASDIILEEPASLKGVYKGRYIVTIGEQKTQQPIDWTFDDISYHMFLDPTDPSFIEGVCDFCKVYGRYVVEERVKLTQTGGGLPFEEVNCNSCNDDYSPRGAFTLEQPGDSVKLTYSSKDTLKQILLVRATE
jgi:hypothetical protein